MSDRERRVLVLTGGIAVAAWVTIVLHILVGHP